MNEKNIEKIVKDIKNSFKDAPTNKYNAYQISLYSKNEEDLSKIKKILQSNHEHNAFNFSLSKELYIDESKTKYKLEIKLNY